MAGDDLNLNKMTASVQRLDGGRQRWKEEEGYQEDPMGATGSLAQGDSGNSVQILGLF